MKKSERRQMKCILTQNAKEKLILWPVGALQSSYKVKGLRQSNPMRAVNRKSHDN